MPRTVKHPKARRDLLLIYVYLGEHNLDAAERFLAAVNADIQRPGSTPLIGTIRTFQNPKLAGLRSWRVSGFDNYLILYRPTASEVQILRVIHGARDIERVLNQ